MRGAPWLVCLVTVLVGLVAMPLAAHAQTDAGPREASPFEPGRPRTFHAAGDALLHITGACLERQGGCYGDLRAEEGTFFLEAPALDGDVVVSWRPVNESLRVLRVRVAGMELEGESPLRFVVPGLPAGEHRVLAAPVHRVVGAFDQPVDWIASFTLGEPSPYVESHGVASFGPSSRCVLPGAAGCEALTQRISDELIVPWPARGTLTATWDERDGERVVCVRGTERCAAGATPLTLTLEGLPAGSYRLDARPAGVETPASSGTIAWTATLVPS